MELLFLQKDGKFVRKIKAILDECEQRGFPVSRINIGPQNVERLVNHIINDVTLSNVISGNIYMQLHVEPEKLWFPLENQSMRYVRVVFVPQTMLISYRSQCKSR